MVLGWVVFLLFAECSIALENTTVSKRCMEDTNTFLWELTQDRPKEYAVLMYDAFGKMGSNVEGGNAFQSGSSGECRSAHGPTFSGQYCQVFLKQGAVRYIVDICVPDSCEEEEVTVLVLYGTLQFGQTSLIPALPHILVNESTQQMIMLHCLSDSIALDAFDIICLFVVCVMVAIPLAATLFTAIIRWQRNREVSPTAESSSLNSGINLYGTLTTNGSSNSEIKSSCSEESSDNSTSHNPLCLPRSRVYQCLQAFSLQTTTQGVLNTSSTIPGGVFSSMSGIRVLSLLWIMCGHSLDFFFTNNRGSYKTWMKTVENSPLYVFFYSGPVFLGVDTFLVLGGVLSARSLLGAINRADDKLSPSLVANYLFKRFKRIQPLHLFILCLAIGVSSLVKWEPNWVLIKSGLGGCDTYWWTKVLLISNFFTDRIECLNWTWYLSLDIQCYATTPLLVYFYRQNRGVFAVVAGGLLLMTIVSSAVLTALLQLPVFSANTGPWVCQNPFAASNYYTNYYAKPYTRYGPFLIGILTGIYLTTKKDPLLKQKWQAALGWFCSLSLMALVFGLAYVLKEAPDYPSVPHALYQGLHRQLWALAVTWIIVACEEGYGGFIKSLMSLGFWVPLCNMSFACYLTHPLIMLWYTALQEGQMDFSDINFIYLFLGEIVLTLVVSYVCTVLVEKPFVLLKWSST